MKVVITSGDPAGCGPLITLEAIKKLSRRNIDFFVVADKKIFKRIPLYKKLKGRINLIGVNTPQIEKLKKGRPSYVAGKASLDYLNHALKLMKEMKIKRLITAPVSKESVKYVLPAFRGHTEYLAGYFKVRQVVMMMVSPKLKVVLFTRHIPLREVAVSLDRQEFVSAVSLVYSSLQRMFKIPKPKIALSSLNPHAGVDTFLDKEERMIAEAVKKFPQELYGPYPAGTIFLKDNLKKYHCIISPYHDQAMVAFKLLSFNEGVNVTLGLPIIRTSPAHGVAYSCLREKKKPFSSSMVEAIKLSLRLSI